MGFREYLQPRRCGQRQKRLRWTARCRYKVFHQNRLHTLRQRRPAGKKSSQNLLLPLQSPRNHHFL